MKDDVVTRRVPVAMYFMRASSHEPLDGEGRKWLADQLCSETRVHEDRTMSVGWIPAQAAYEYPNLIDEIERLRALLGEVGREVASIKNEAERENGRWQHLRRCIAVQSRDTLTRIDKELGND